MPIEKRNEQISLSVPIQDKGQVVWQEYIVTEGKLLNPEIFGLPFRDPQALPKVIASLCERGVGAQDNQSGFTKNVVTMLNDAVQVSRQWPEDF